MSNQNHPLPRSAWLLGLAGLIPFVAPVVMALLGNAQYLSVQRSYAVCILSFLGAMHWGPALYMGVKRPTPLLIWGVVPALFAWAALQLPVFIQALVLAAGFIVAMIADLLLAPLHHWAKGYLTLRTVLSVVAIGCLCVTHIVQR